MPQEQQGKSTRESTTEEDPQHQEQRDLTEEVQALKRDVDKLFDEIDEILEDSEEFVENYVQRGGE